MFTLPLVAPAWSSLAPAAAVLLVASGAGIAATASPPEAPTAIVASAHSLQQTDADSQSGLSQAAAPGESPSMAGVPASTVLYSPPVAAPVVDSFRPPTSFAGAGNRGLAYATAPGSAVQAAAGGTVVFAGAIGGHSYVTIRHADGIRTSYAFLATIGVSSGDSVVAGAVIGATGDEPFHLGARVGDTYIDPALLMTPGDFAVAGRGGAPAKLPRSILVPRVGVAQ